MNRHAVLVAGVIVLATARPSAGDSFRDTSTLVRIRMIEAALDAFRADTGRLPSADEGLRVLIERPASADGWKGPYLAELPPDAWGEPLIYRSPGRVHAQAFDLYSKGSNLQDESGAEDDITSWSGVPHRFYRRPFPWGFLVASAGAVAALAALIGFLVVGIRRVRGSRSA